MPADFPPFAPFFVWESGNQLLTENSLASVGQTRLAEGVSVATLQLEASARPWVVSIRDKHGPLPM